MQRYLIQKLLWVIPIIFLVTSATFMLLHLIPGDPVDVLLGFQADEKSANLLRQQLGLDQPLHVQYVKWLGRMLHGDLGQSIRTPYKVIDQLVARFPVSLELVLLSLILSLGLGIPIGALAGRRPGSFIDAAATTFASVGIGVPSFLVGIVLIYVVAVELKWLPVSGYVPPSKDLAQHLKLMIMPSLTNAVVFLPIVIQQTRSAVLEVYSEMFILVARSKGLNEKRIFYRHALKIVLLPIATITGLRLGVMFGGGVITETIFDIPGMGRALVESIFARDFPLVQAITLIVAVTVLFANLLVDLIYVYLDPRIKYG